MRNNWAPQFVPILVVVEDFQDFLFARKNTAQIRWENKVFHSSARLISSLVGNNGSIKKQHGIGNSC
jgi:hypothetical protein